MSEARHDSRVRALRGIAKAASFRLHRLALRFGVFVAPRHYYTSMSSVIDLERTMDVWARKSRLPGIQAPIERQADDLRRICLPFRSEYEGNAVYLEAARRHSGPGYGYIEAQALHAVIRHFRPARVIEVGSGVSTFCMLHALRLNEADGAPPARLTTIEPYPAAALRSLDGIERIEAQVQTVPVSRFEELGAGDVLFIDSSHTVRPGSDVNYIILEVLPRLSEGVVVHFHDIYLPYDYQRDLLRTYFQWSETTLLRAYLTHNDRARILFCLSQLHYDEQSVLREVFPEYEPAPDDNGLEVGGHGRTKGHFPASLYFTVQ